MEFYGRLFLPAEKLAEGKPPSQINLPSPNQIVANPAANQNPLAVQNAPANQVAAPERKGT